VSAATAADSKSNAPAKSGTYEVARAGGKCAVSGRTIEPNEKYYAVLRETPAGFERLDIAAEHWAEFDKTGALGFWQTVMPLHEQKKKVFVDDDVLCGLFERLADTTEPAKLNFRFVLGLILMRKRLLIYETSRTNELGNEVWAMRFKGKEDLLDMINPRLDEQQVKEVSTQLGEILNEEV
jgi:hypothetical protein